MTSASSDIKISCRNVWKLYGPDPQAMLAQHRDGAGLGPEVVEQIKIDGHIPAVVDASLEVRSGEILVLMGLSGSGKSTLVRCLSRLVEPTAGEIWLDDQNLLNATDKELIQIRRRKMGMVFQHFALFPHRTVIENVAFPLEVQKVPKAERLAKADKILSLVGLEGRGNYYPRELSGGQQQRVGIGRSLAVEPEVWFLDEPFSALDPLIRREMQDEFVRLQSELHKTIVFITHDFDEAIRLADRIAILYEGQIVQLGSAEELVTNPATDYVRAFTRDVQRDKILRVASVMTPLAGDSVVPEVGGDRANTVAASALLDTVAAKVISNDRPLTVLDDTGQPVGLINRERLVAGIYPGGS